MRAAEIDPGDRAGQGLSRRTFLGRAGAGVVLSGSLAGLLGAGGASAHGGRPPDGHSARGPRRNGAPGYGPLVPDPAGVLSLPKGFTYTIVAQAGTTKLAGGRPSPSDPDGMAAFVRPGGDGSLIVMNHEIDEDEPYPVPKVPGLVYDGQANGGCTILEVDGRGRRVRQSVGLAGTLNNCAGGSTPWGTWLTCEETERILGKPHGYVFEVDPYDEDANLDPSPIKCLGRYSHEACAVDPLEGRIYLSEDASEPHGLLYRWTPPRSALPLGREVLKSLPPDAGRLEALVARTRNGAVVPDLSLATGPGTRYRAGWVEVPDRDASSVSTRRQFSDGTVTRSRKFEGLWWGDGGAYVVCSYARTTDGSAKQHDGQVWFVDPLRDTIELKLIFAYTPGDQDGDPDGPDNITVSPYGGVIIAEDGEGRQHLVGATEGGAAFPFARNEDPEGSEFCGPTFSHDRRTLFASVQSPGTTFAIRGPFTGRGDR